MGGCKGGGQIHRDREMSGTARCAGCKIHKESIGSWGKKDWFLALGWRVGSTDMRPLSISTVQVLPVTTTNLKSPIVEKRRDVPN